MKTIILDVNRSEQRVLVCDEGLTNCRYEEHDVGEDVQPDRSVAYSYVKQAHYVANIKACNATHGLTIDPHPAVNPTNWFRLGGPL